MSAEECVSSELTATVVAEVVTFCQSLDSSLFLFFDLKVEDFVSELLLSNNFVEVAT